MIRIIDGVPMVVPDDARITPELVQVRTRINDFLGWISTDSPERRSIDAQYLKGSINMEDGFDWFSDPSLSSSPEPRPSNPVHTADVSLGSRAVGASPQGSDVGSGTRES